MIWSNNLLTKFNDLLYVDFDLVTDDFSADLSGPLYNNRFDFFHLEIIDTHLDIRLINLMTLKIRISNVSSVVGPEISRLLSHNASNCYLNHMNADANHVVVKTSPYVLLSTFLFGTYKLHNDTRPLVESTESNIFAYVFVNSLPHPSYQ